MRVILTLAWIMAGLLAVGFHFGPGQERVLLDEVAKHLSAAETFTDSGDWNSAEREYKAALQALPQERVAEAQRIRVERDKALLRSSQLPAAYSDLLLLVEELKNEVKPDKALLADAQSALATSRYYLTWLMRVEGLPQDAWEEEIEAARQTYRHLAEQALADGQQAAATQHQEDMESAIRLARMDLAELQGLSIPKQCQGCCSGNCKKPGNGKKKGQGKKKKDARGASSGPPPDDGGS